MTLGLLERGQLLRHQGQVLLRRTRQCSVGIARAVEAELLPAGATLSPSDLRRAVDRLVLLHTSQDDPAAVEEQHERAAADRRTPVDQDQDQLSEHLRRSLGPEVVVDAAEPQHDPSALLARLVDLRDTHCCGTGCSSTRTDRDHLEPWPAGQTSAADLGRLSARCGGRGQ